MAPLVEVEDLRVTFEGPRGPVHAVDGVGFTLGRERLGIVGESGSGKTMTGRALLGLTPPGARVSARRLVFDGVDLLAAGPAKLRSLRGRRMAMVMQDPRYSLNPVMRVGDQIAEAVRVSRKANRAEARAAALKALADVRIHAPERVYDLYPHEVSGGMGQRVMIAMMLAPGPDLLVADEITSALDVTVQMQVLAILDDLVARKGMGLVFISHDLELVASFCDRVLITYGGRVVESCRASELDRATHPYTRGLLGCLPRLDAPRERLATLDRDPAWARAGRDG
jgi:peptide/nickel transport system ATP-binding protein